MQSPLLGASILREFLLGDLFSSPFQLNDPRVLKKTSANIAMRDNVLTFSLCTLATIFGSSIVDVLKFNAL